MIGIIRCGNGKDLLVFHKRRAVRLGSVFTSHLERETDWLSLFELVDAFNAMDGGRVKS